VHYKSCKLTEEDWRNREKWPQYEGAANEMLLRTSTPAAPWTIVEAEDKRFARVKVLSTLVQRLESELGEVDL
jgi:polyphosphate kinase 2 (PPK2 family)